jgi:ectoine hydroxylase-related dioxygenase (phytanoyl-CoA dioxygenase family)
MSKDGLRLKGYTVIEDIYSPDELNVIAGCIIRASTTKPTFRRKSDDLFAIRQFLNEVPEVQPLVFNPKLNAVIAEYFGLDYFAIKSIYFDKPERSNWFVAWHQDLTISVDKKIELPGFGHWTIKQGQYAVRPPESILENIFTIRIHLDDTNEENGALRVIPESHLKGVYKHSAEESGNEEEICRVKSGGIMIMRPLLQHASNRTTGGNRRRVIHIEFSNLHLPDGLAWAEQIRKTMWPEANSFSFPK